MIEARTAREWVVRLQDGEALADGLQGLESDSVRNRHGERHQVGVLEWERV